MKISYHSKILQLLLIILITASCKPSVPSKYIQPNDMEDILYEYHLSQALAKEKLNTDSVSYYKNIYYRSILQNYGYTENDFDSSLVYYYTHAYRLHDIYRNVSQRLSNDVEKYGAAVGEIGKYTQYNTEGDTANVWTNVSSAILTPKPMVNRFDFEIEADTTYQRGDSFLFNFMTSFLYQSGTKDAILYFAVKYKNDSIYAQTRRISVTGLTQIRVKGNKDSDVERIMGFIYLNRGNDDSNTLKLMFIDQIQLIRFHPETPIDTVKINKDEVVQVKVDSVNTKNEVINPAVISSSKTTSSPYKAGGEEKLKLRKEPLKMSDIKIKRNVTR